MRAFNLIPPDERSSAGIDTGKSGGGAFVVLGLIAVLAIFALLYGVASHQISSQNAKVATLTAQAQAAQAQAARLAPYVSFMALHEQRVQAVDQLVDSRFDWAHAFHEIGRVLPKNASLSSISGTIGSTTGAASTASPVKSTAAAAGSTVTSATPPGSIPTFTLSGCATSQTVVALTLTRLRLIDGVSEVTLQSSTKPGSAGGSAGGGGGASGGCKGNQATFAMLITFDPLPSVSATSTQSTTSTASAGAATSSTGQTTTSTGGAG
jgi:Tfp pilus assembly protein PilN